jgi:hypothetical protein
MKYYGCYLKNFQWTCKKFTSMEEADEYTSTNRSGSYMTKLVLMSGWVPPCFERSVLEEKLKHGLKQEDN